MNILVIGNGFDLAHGLPTKYTDFLEFSKIILAIFKDAKPMDKKSFEDKYLREWKVNKEIIEGLEYIHYCMCIQKNENNYLNEHPYLSELYQMIQDNIWIEYFFQCSMYQKENWIDFESAITEVIKSLDKDMHKLSGDCSLDDNIISLSNKFLKSTYSKYIFTVQILNSAIDGSCESITFREIRNKLLEDLKRLIRAFEIYLTEYVEKIDYKLVSPDIQGIMPKESMKYKSGYNELYVLSFNYTNTYQRIYMDKAYEQTYTKKYIDYIHGKADINNTIESNNMVLGIDEYLSKKRRNKETEFITFKKFYQRIHKQTGCEYREWINKIIQKNKAYKENLRLNQLDFERNRGMGDGGFQTKKNLKNLEENPPKYNLYFFGHSLDVTDKDILRDLILTENIHTTIFYHSKDVMGQQIANLVKVIGQDELIKRTGGSTKTIEFKQQQNMVKINS